MATRDTTAERASRIGAIVEAAMLLPPADRAAWVAQACGPDRAMRREVEALIARQESLARLTPENRERVSGLFHAALSLRPEERGLFLDVACARVPDVRREVESLLAHASDTSFLEDSPARLTDVLVPPSAPPPTPQAPPRPPRSSDPMIGRKIGPYVIQRKLGEGGMGVVYFALDPKLQRPVAIKVPRPDALQAEYRARLVAEARAAATLAHQNVASVYALFEEDDEIFIVYEFVDGPTLRAVIERGPLSYTRLVRVFPDVARGLAHAHEHGIIHRDIKPENIIITAEDVPKIVDFGLAKSVQAIVKSTTTRVRTATELHPGTPAYMAPEQIEEPPGRRLDFRADLFSFGVTLYEAASGLHPFEGATLWTTLENIKRQDPPKLRNEGNELDRLERIIYRCLQKNPEERYASTAALVSDLDALRLPPVFPVQPVPPPVPVPVRPRRDAAWWWRFHQVAVSATYGATLAWLYVVHALVRPVAAGLALFIACAIATVPGVALRLFRCWASVNYQPARFQTLLGRVRPPVRTGDWIFCGSLIATTGLLYAGNRPGTATALGIVALACLVVFLVVEPETEQEAFGEPPGTGSRPPAASAGSPQTIRGTVIAIGDDAMTVKTLDGDATFGVADTTEVVARSGARVRCEAPRSGVPGVRASDLVKVGDGVDVTYRETGGARQATMIRVDD